MGFIKQTEQFGDYSVASTDLSNYFVISEYTFAYNPSRINVGSIAYKSQGKQNSIVSPLYISFKTTEKLGDTYLWYWFKTQNFEKQREVFSEGGVRDTLSFNQLSEMQIYIPQLLEQQNIGILLTNIQKFITLQERKLELYKQLKKYLLQKMFANEQEKAPQIRFKGFDGKWEKKRLENYFSESNKRSSKGKMLSVTINHGVIPFCKLNKKDNSSKDKSKYKLVNINDIAYNTMRMWQGACGVSNYCGIVSPAYTVITPNKSTSPDFFVELFKQEKIKQLFQKHSQGLTSDTWNLKFPLFKKIGVYVPLIDEQNLISNELKKINKKLLLQENQINFLSAVKQYLLQNLFC
ncbi:restriction endonuclease subunit S [Lactobacillus sp. ESL0785]|uniref:restriction endonuclease subunit S n=1 Tax=Lactobacillus sp. ESL0785 TaxID=2983232 RepID=UPI0023F8CB9D|nr:restriction endonuclease subunit S [Lactobacillus sp. ESL0785]WEV70367.1 restriction endonuclease subunit S [Lactobacillus sp. ESL0785]